jgi:indole-3-glycerol phosphate synthase/phosphoribosylanthranilate isomerase
MSRAAVAENVLAEIVRRKRSQVEARLAGVLPDPRPTRRSLRSALARPGARFIMEVKKRSPSGHRSEVDVATAANAYAPVADAISVLTDGPFFGGALEDLCKVRASFDGPILAKDFVIDPRQVGEARLHGADAVLVILSALEDAAAAQVMGEARRLNMDVIVEVHDETELGRALALGAQIIGINNRDLKTLESDLSVTERLAPLVPNDRVLISESGIGSRQDVERLSAAVDAFLVGSSLMASKDIAQAARALVFGPVKICGLTVSHDVAAAANAGATHAGLIFAEYSPRQVGGQAVELAAEARRAGLHPVGVFGRQGKAHIVRLARDLQLRAVQLHGPRDAQALRAALPPECEIWGVSGVGADAEPPCGGADRTLFDTRSGGRTGGTGRTFDWRILAGRPDLRSAFIAGGIGPANARAAQRVGAYGIDVGSAVESAPGRKDHAKLRALFDVLRLPSRGAVSC